MPLKLTTNNSLNSVVDLASDQMNTNMDFPPVTLPASSSGSEFFSHVSLGSSSGPGLSVEALATSIVNALRPLLATANVNQPMVSSQPAASHTVTSCLSLPISNSQAVVSSAQLPASVQPSSIGRLNVVPSFVNTFALPTVSSLNLPLSLSSSPLSAPISSTSFATNLTSLGLSTPSTPSFQQPFIVGPGFSPVPYKLVSQIVSGKFVDLAELLSDNLKDAESEPQLLFDGRIVLTSTNKRQKTKIADITAWSEAFSIFTLILVSHYLSRWRDLTLYKLLILRTYRQFQGNAWLTYDRVFREHAAAANLTD